MNLRWTKTAMWREHQSVLQVLESVRGSLRIHTQERDKARFELADAQRAYEAQIAELKRSLTDAQEAHIRAERERKILLRAIDRLTP